MKRRLSVGKYGTRTSLNKLELHPLRQQKLLDKAIVGLPNFGEHLISIAVQDLSKWIFTFSVGDSVAIFRTLTIRRLTCPLIFSCQDSLDFSPIFFGFFINSLLFFSFLCSSLSDPRRSLAVFTVAMELAVRCFQWRRGVVIDQFAGDGIESVDIEVAGDGRVILALLARHGGGNNVGMVDDDGHGSDPTKGLLNFLPHCK